MARARTTNPDQLAGIQRVRDARIRPRAVQSLQREMDRALGDIKKLRRAVSACAGAWQRTIPSELVERTALEGVARGVLTVRVPDAATRFELDRFLRAGGWRSFTRDCAADLIRVRSVVG
jgi:hypothetical protein